MAGTLPVEPDVFEVGIAGGEDDDVRLHVEQHVHGGHRGVDIRPERAVLKTLRRDLADDHGDAVRPEEVVEAELPLADFALLVSGGANARLG